MSLPERVASLALETFAALPQRCKPRTQINGRQEWTPMSAIIVASKHPSTQEPELRCVSLATGTKCLPATSVPKCAGLVLHDSHAEILALRGLNRWLLNEIQIVLLDPEYISAVVQPCHKLLSFHESGKTLVSTGTQSRSLAAQEWWQGSVRPFGIREGVKFHMFCSTAPCGDASMELLMGMKDDATPWDVIGNKHASNHDLDQDEVNAVNIMEHRTRGTNTAILSVENNVGNHIPLGRGFFSILGAMRRKPARADAEATMSKSCTDKLAFKQFRGVLAFPLDLLLDGSGKAFLSSLVVYEDQFDSIGYNRAFGREGRLQELADRIKGSKFFDVYVLPRDFPRFEFEKRLAMDETSGKVSNISAVYVAETRGTGSTTEVLVNGVKQGYKQFEERDGKGSILCRRKMVETLLEIRKVLETKGFSIFKLQEASYSELKMIACREMGRRDKDYILRKLGGWSSNSNEDDFRTDEIGTTLTSRKGSKRC